MINRYVLFSIIVVILNFFGSFAAKSQDYSASSQAIDIAERYILRTITDMCDLKNADQISIISEERADNFAEDVVVEAALTINGNGPYVAVVAVDMDSDGNAENLEFLGVNFGCSSFNQE